MKSDTRTFQVQSRSASAHNGGDYDHARAQARLERRVIGIEAVHQANEMALL